MLNAGNKIGMIKKAFSDVLKLGFGRIKIVSLFILYAIIDNRMHARLKVINSETVDKGVSYPRLSDKLFINKPKNNKKEMLSPHDKINFSKKSVLFDFSIWRINNPGKIVRKRNPKICLRKGIFKNIAKSVEIINNVLNKKKPLKPLVVSIFSYMSSQVRLSRIFENFLAISRWL